MNNTAVIQLEGVSKKYPIGEKPAVTDVHLTVVKGEFLVLVGPSGCGKSTLIKMIAGLEQPSGGEVHAPEKVSMVFQSGALLPWLTAAQNVAVALEAAGVAASTTKRKTRLYLDMMGLQGLHNKYPRELSGGQRQRVGLARALAVEPEVLVLDEPFAALDIKTIEFLHQDLLKIWTETKQTIVMVSHSIEEAVTLADRVVLMNAGRIARDYNLVDMDRPRREQGAEFMDQVQAIRKDFLATDSTN